MLLHKYQDEQIDLEEKISMLKTKLSQSAETEKNAERWISLIRKYTGVTELTSTLLNELIEKIVIHQGTTTEDGFRDQEIEVYYRFIGKID